MLPMVSAKVDQLSTFALLGKRTDRAEVYLPLILRQ
jgi:hypothetical protein